MKPNWKWGMEESSSHEKSIAKISITDRLVYWFYQSISRYQNGLLSLSSGFLIGRITNELSVPHTNWFDVLRGLFDFISRPTNLLTWLSVAILITIPVINRVTSRLYKKKQYESILTAILERYKDRSIAPYSGLSFGSSLTLRLCPSLSRGWSSNQVKILHDSRRYVLPEQYRKEYRIYLKKHSIGKRLHDDEIKIMLKKVPTSFSDSPTLVLETQETLYSQVLFWRDNIAISPDERSRYIRNTTEKHQIDFPHSFCMHLILVTKDDKVLITKRSPDVAYFPETWSCSVEEQLKLQDIEGGDNFMQKWFERVLREEIGIGSKVYDPENLRVLSVFLESDILSVAVCAYASLEITSQELDQILRYLPRADYEFTEWNFLSHEELVHELFRPQRFYHPTSGYRMLMALIKRFGEPRIVEILLHQH